MIRDYVMFCLIGICGISMIFVSITNSISRRRKYALTNMAYIAILLLVADKLSDVYNGNIGKEYWIARICKFGVYALFLLIIFMFNIYLKDLFIHEGQEQEVPKELKYVDIVIIVGEIVLVISRFTNLYYTYGDNNVYQRSKGFAISYLFPVVALVMQLTVILKYSGKFRKRLLLPLVMFTIAPIITAIPQFFVHGVSFVICTVVSMIVLLYAFSILDANRIIEEAHQKQVQMLLEKQNNTKMMIAQTTSALVEAIDAKDPYTKGHSKRVAEYAMKIAEKSGKGGEECEKLFLIALLHDVGKIGIPSSIINKAASLTEDEEELMKTHPKIGKEILEKINAEPDLIIGAAYHHEWYNGKGYPYGLKGEAIPEIARIIAVADTYDAMASKRSYRDILPQNIVREEIVKGIGTQFDPVYAKIMLELIDADTEYQMRQM